VTLAKGEHRGIDARFYFRERTGSEPEEVFLRYYLRFANDWYPAHDGGKLPGIAGTYERAGWGGRRSDGTNGWSMRGMFGPLIRAPHPLADQTPIATYAYHADMEGSYGDRWSWSKSRPGTLRRERWYCLEQQVRVNAIGSRDGIVRAWIDGELALERMGVRVRETDSIRIESVWLNIYYGGTQVAPRDMNVYVDQVVIATQRIGCRSGQGAM